MGLLVWMELQVLLFLLLLVMLLPPLLLQLCEGNLEGGLPYWGGVECVTFSLLVSPEVLPIDGAMRPTECRFLWASNTFFSSVTFYS